MSYSSLVQKAPTGRRTAFVITILFITLILWLLGAGLFNQDAVGNDEEMIQVVVEEGDNLWSICQRLGAKGDLRKAIYQVKLINNMDNANVYPGQVLWVPVY